MMQVVDHYDNPRNVGSFQKGDANVGTGLVGAPACGDVMKLQIRVLAQHTLSTRLTSLTSNSTCGSLGPGLATSQKPCCRKLLSYMICSREAGQPACAL